MAGNNTIVRDPWTHLRALTDARIALGRTGVSLPTDEVLRFGYAHARARDAVHLPLDFEGLCRSLTEAGFESRRVQSAAPDRASYLLRPDRGRQLHPASAAMLRSEPGDGCDVLPVIGDGLSSLAVARHALPVLIRIREALPSHLRLGPVVAATHARVALGDAIGEILRARLVLVLIGERPGLSSPDSLGIYLTHAPRSGRQDAERNCISNIRPEGLDYGRAAHKAVWLTSEALRLGLSGVGLKDGSDVAAMESRPYAALPGSD